MFVSFEWLFIKIFDLPLYLAMTDSGMGPTQLNSFLSELNIPPLSTSLLKRHENVSGLAFEKIAKESCERAVKMEIELTMQDKYHEI